MYYGREVNNVSQVIANYTGFENNRAAASLNY